MSLPALAATPAHACAELWIQQRPDLERLQVSLFKTAKLWYDGAIMMARTQITLEPEIQRRARQRASDLGVSFAEYVRRLVARDLGSAHTAANPAAVFDLGTSGGSDVAKEKNPMIAEAFTSAHKKSRRR